MVGTCADPTQCCSKYGYCYNDCDHCCAYYFSGPHSAPLIRNKPHYALLKSLNDACACLKKRVKLCLDIAGTESASGMPGPHT